MFHWLVFLFVFQPVIQRHFWHKRGQVIEQAQRWMAQANRDLASFAAGKADDTMEMFDIGQTTFKGMEKTVQTLTDELLALAPPIDD